MTYDPELEAHACAYCDYAIRSHHGEPVTFPDPSVSDMVAVIDDLDAAWHPECAEIVNGLEDERETFGRLLSGTPVPSHLD